MKVIPESGGAHVIRYLLFIIITFLQRNSLYLLSKKSIPVFQEAKILFPLAFLSCSLFLEARRRYNKLRCKNVDRSLSIIGIGKFQ
jgi:predicted MPP superfamily phosphohydrolase